MNAPAHRDQTQPGSRLALLGFLCLVALGAVFRLVDLDSRLMHGDEANQAIKTAVLLETGEYAYDPQEHHGPTLYYFSWVVERLLGHATRADMTETCLRVVPALFGIGTVALLWLLRDALGTPATLFAALLMSLSPALTFYSRYYIQETLLTFFTLAAVACAWRYFRNPRIRWAAGFGASIGLMVATKETWVIAAACMAAAIAVARLWKTASNSDTNHPPYSTHAATALLVATIFWALFFSSFGTHWRGLVDSMAAYAPYLDRGGQAGLHEHGWDFYLRRLVWHHRGPGPHWTEAFILVSAAAGALVTVVRPSRDERYRFRIFLTVFCTGMLIVFSLIPYKTPWNLVQFQAPLCLLGGAGLGAIWGALRRRALRAALLTVVMAASAHLGWLNYAANFEYPEYPYNPYVYGHTSSAFRRLIDRIDTVASERPEGHQMLIAVIQPDGDYWPLPWYLRTYSRVGYWTAIPDPLPDAAVFIVDSDTATALHERLKDSYTFELHGLRPSVLRTVYVKKIGDNMGPSPSASGRPKN